MLCLGTPRTRLFLLNLKFKSESAFFAFGGDGYFRRLASPNVKASGRRFFFLSSMPNPPSLGFLPKDGFFDGLPLLNAKASDGASSFFFLNAESAKSTRRNFFFLFLNVPNPPKPSLLGTGRTDARPCPVSSEGLDVATSKRESCRLLGLRWWRRQCNGLYRRGCLQKAPLF